LSSIVYSLIQEHICVTPRHINSWGSVPSRGKDSLHHYVQTMLSYEYGNRGAGVWIWPFTSMWSL